MTILDNVFDNDVDVDEALSLIRLGEFKGAKNVKSELEYNEGWYNYSSLTFDYNSKRYLIKYKEHSSDNVSDFEYLYETFVCLGIADEMDNTVTIEFLERERADYQLKINSLQNKVAKLTNERDRSNEKLNKLSNLTKEQIKHLAKLFDEANNDTESKNTIYKDLSEFFYTLYEREN